MITRMHLLITIVAIALGPMLVAARQDRSTVRSVDGIALSEFKGYESWPLISPSVPPNGIKAILGNTTMMKAIGAGVVTSGAKVPDGAMMAKITWTAGDHAHLPGAAMSPNVLRRVQFMVKDTSRFSATDGWGYAQFDFDAEIKTYNPAQGATASAKSCHQCHTRVRARDFVFTDYALR